jgi:hypothetical protein
MKKYLFIASIFVVNLSHAQRFQRYYLPPAGVVGSDVLTSGVDNTATTGAAAVGFYSTTVAGAVQRQVRFVRINDDGSALSNRSIRLRNNVNAAYEDAYATSMAPRIVAGTQNYTAAGRVGTAGPDALFMNLNNTGTPGNIRRFTFGAGSSDESTCIRPSTFYADNFYMCGNTTPANVVSPYSKNFFLICTNGLGVVQRAISYSYALTTATGAPIYASASSVVEDPVNNVVWVVGQAVEINPTGATKSGLLVKINGLNGNLLNAYTYGFSAGANGRIEGFKAIRRLSTNKYIVLGTMNNLPAGGAGIGAGAAGDVLINFDLLGAAPVIMWQKGYNFNTGTAASVAPINGKDVIELKEVTGATSLMVCGKYPNGNQKAIFKVDAAGLHMANSLYEAGKTGDLFALAQTGDVRYPDEVLGFGTSPNGNTNKSYIVKALPGLATVTSASCLQQTLSKYEVALNLSPVSLNHQRSSGTSTAMVYTSTTFISDFCVVEPAAPPREAVANASNDNISTSLDFRKMDIFPNPSQSEASVSIRIQTNENEAQVEIIDFMGRNIRTETIKLEANQQIFNLPIADLKTGSYVIRVKNQEGIRTQRLSKN